MKLYKTKVVETDELIGIKCDVCGQIYKEENESDWIHIQEMITINKNCGFGSLFGDGNIISIDICEECFYHQYEDKVKYLYGDE